MSAKWNLKLNPGSFHDSNFGLGEILNGRQLFFFSHLHVSIYSTSFKLISLIFLIHLQCLTLIPWIKTTCLYKFWVTHAARNSGKKVVTGIVKMRSGEICSYALSLLSLCFSQQNRQGKFGVSAAVLKWKLIGSFLDLLSHDIMFELSPAPVAKCRECSSRVVPLCVSARNKIQLWYRCKSF